MKPLSILETALYVQHLDTSEEFYRDLFGFKTLISDERMRAMQISEHPTQILLLFRIGGSTGGEETRGGFIPPHDGRGIQHLALAIQWDTLDWWRERLKAQEVAIESEVEANAGYSLYFRDPDGHCIELGIAGLWSMSEHQFQSKSPFSI